MMIAASAPWVWTLVFNVLVFLAVGAAALIAYQPLRHVVLRQQMHYESVLRGKLLIDVRPRTAMILTGAGIALMMLLGYLLTGSHLGAIAGLVVGAFLPYFVLRYLRLRRLGKLENQLVGGIQSLTSGVRAGLNLVQAMELIARDGPVPIRQEFAHLLREYEYGMPLDQAMRNASDRIGSTDFRLLFSALHTHRERGGDLGATLDRIAESIREIQRLEKRVQSLTAQGRATARWLGALPFVVLAILYLIVDASSIDRLLRDDVGRLILFVIALLNVAGFLWIRKVVSIDI